MTELLTDHKKIILLVEDNPDDIDLTLRALKKSNILNDVVVARDGEEALDYLFGTGAHANEPMPIPQVILLDLKLPRIGGIEVLRRLRANARTCFVPVVILTSSTEDRDLKRCYELGANSYVHKPVDFGQFVEATRALGVYWLALNVMPECPTAKGGKE